MHFTDFKDFILLSRIRKVGKVSSVRVARMSARRCGRGAKKCIFSSNHADLLTLLPRSHYSAAETENRIKFHADTAENESI